MMTTTPHTTTEVSTPGGNGISTNGWVLIIAAVALAIVQIIAAASLAVVQYVNAQEQQHVNEKTSDKLETIHKDTNSNLSNVNAELSRALSRIEQMDLRLADSQERLERALKVPPAITPAENVGDGDVGDVGDGSG